MGYDTGRDELLAVATLIIVMALIEVVLLAGPAFAVGARRHARTLALIAASGGTPAQARRVILGSGVVLGLVASAVGLVLGLAVGWAVLPLVQRFNNEWFGPLELPWSYLAAIAAFGIVSAILASVVPAWLASRQDVVAVLAGRRGDRKPRASTPVVGLALLGAGIATSVYGAATSDDSSAGAYWIGASAIVSVLGMILVVPVVVSTVARLARRLPLTPRYAARDAARHRTRTVPAVAAVAATVAGVVALGIATESQELADEKTYTRAGADGHRRPRLDGRRAAGGGGARPGAGLGPDRGSRGRGRARGGHERAPRSVREPRVRWRVDLHLRPVDRPRSGLLPVHAGVRRWWSPTPRPGSGSTRPWPPPSTARSRPVGRWSSPRAWRVATT